MKVAGFAVSGTQRYGANLFVITSHDVPCGGFYMTELGECGKASLWLKAPAGPDSKGCLLAAWHQAS